MNTTMMRCRAGSRNSAVPQPQLGQRLSSVRPALRLPLANKPSVGARSRATIVCSFGVAHPGEEAAKSEFSGRSSFNPMLSVPSTTMAAKGGGGGGNFGSGSSLGAVLEKSKLEFVMPTPPSQAPKLDDGGSGGDIGKGIHNGGGGGDGDGGDDDDYFNEDGDGDGEGDGKQDSFFRTVIPESYDQFSIGAVFAEWMRTIAELPLILRRAVEMGLFSSAQLVRFFSMDVRPNMTRSLSRALPPTWARDFVGRLMADPAFVQKMVLESSMAAVASLYYEYRARGERFKDELDLVLINTIGMAAATGATVWMVSPTRSYGSVHKFPWQQMLDGLPNCVFDANGPLRSYTTQSRVGAFFTKSAELSAVGLLMGGATSLLSSAAVAIRRKYIDPNFEPSVPVPELARSSAGLAAFFAISANTRYQLLGGMDRYLVGHSNFLWTYMGCSAVARAVSMAAGEMHRPWCQGLPEPSAQRKRLVKKKVMVRRKVVRAVEEPVAVAQPLQPEVVAAGGGLLLAAAVASPSHQELSQQQHGEEGHLVLDQVLAMPEHSAQQLPLELQQAVASGSAGADQVLVAAGHSHAAGSSSELQSLVAQQASGAVALPTAEQLARSVGQLAVAAPPAAAALHH